MAPKGSNIVVTAQQTRFDAREDGSSKDIDVGDLTITIGKREILSHTRLVLKAGLRYVFVGRNGTGKSTVLKALAERKVPGVASNIRMLLLDQTSTAESQELNGDAISKNGSGQEKRLSVIEHVVSSDKPRLRAIEDSATLSDALQEGDATKIVQVYRTLKLQQAERELETAQLVAQHRSGARGAKARQALLSQEAVVDEAKQSLEEAPSDSNANSEMNSAVEMLESLQICLDAMGASSLEATARKVLIGLGFSQEQIEGPLDQLSGGWQTRAALAAALIQRTDLLMLDEPTNFLDLPAVIWLQHYLQAELAEGTTLLVTTHDRDFADAVAERLLILRITPPCTLQTFNGTLSDYYAETYRQIRRMTKMAEAQARQTEHMQSTISKSVAAAKRTGDDKRLKQAASRKKKLNERSGLEVGAKGGRFKLNRDLAGWHTKNRADIEVPEFDPPVSMVLPQESPELRNSGILVNFENVSFTYKKAAKATLNNINLSIEPGSRTGIVGLNGSGKSTLIKMIVSDFSSPSSSPGKLTGTLTKHSQARISHYSQHETSRLLTLGQANPTLTALSHLQELHPSIQEQPLRALLSGLSLPSQSQANTPMSALSGGQLVRVALAERFLPTPPHLLILDEPTTHLDADSIVALIEALKQLDIALLVVSHDRFFMRCVAEGQTVRQAAMSDRYEEDEDDSDSDSEKTEKSGKVYRLQRTNGKMTHLERGMDQYEEIVVRLLAKQGIVV